MPIVYAIQVTNESTGQTVNQYGDNLPAIRRRLGEIRKDLNRAAYHDAETQQFSTIAKLTEPALMANPVKPYIRVSRMRETRFSRNTHYPFITKDCAVSVTLRRVSVVTLPNGVPVHVRYADLNGFVRSYANLWIRHIDATPQEIGVDTKELSQKAITKVEREFCSMPRPITIDGESVHDADSWLYSVLKPLHEVAESPEFSLVSSIELMRRAAIADGLGTFPFDTSTPEIIIHFQSRSWIRRAASSTTGLYTLISQYNYAVADYARHFAFKSAHLP